MDPYSIFVNDLPQNLTYAQIKASCWPYQTTAPLQILKKEKYLIITFTHKETVQKVLRDKEGITLKGKTVTIMRAFKQFKPKVLHLPPSFFSLWKSYFNLLFYKYQHLHQHLHQSMNIRFRKDFLFFIINSSDSLLLFQFF